MRRMGLILALTFLSPALSMVPSTTSAAEAEVEHMYVKLTLTREGNTYAHPGFLMAADEEGVFVINCEGKDHEITVTFDEVGETRFKLAIDYAINGRTQWIEHLPAEAGEDARLEKGKSVLAINVDPQGSKDTSRDDEDKVEGPGDNEDDPLGGIQIGS